MRLSDLLWPVSAFGMCILILVCDRIHAAAWRVRDRRCTVTVQAEIVSVQPVRAGSGYRRRTRYRAMARYSVDGIEIMGSSRAVMQCCRAPGEKVLVRYDPAYPMSFLLPEDNAVSLKRQVMYDLVIAGAFFLLGWLLVIFM